MTDTIYVVRDPSGKPYACSVHSLDHAWALAIDAWARGPNSSYPSVADGYTLETITLPSAHDAAIVAAAEALTDAARAFFDSGEFRDGRLSENLDAAHKVLFFSVMAKRAAQEAP